MGQESCRKGKHVLLSAACLLAFLWVSPSCSPRTNRWIENFHFGRADALMTEGDFDDALKKNAEILDEFPDSLGDQALYNIGLIYIHPENKAGDDQKALDAFQRILRRYPESPLKEEVQVWILIIYKIRDKEKAIRDANGALALLEEDLRKYEEKTLLLKESINQKEEETEDLRRKIFAHEEQIEELKVQVGDLKARIQKLKKVDLGIEERKRKVLR